MVKVDHKAGASRARARPPRFALTARASASGQASGSLAAHSERRHQAFETGTYRAESAGCLEHAVARPASLHRIVLAGDSVGGSARSRRRFAESAQIGLLLKNRARRTGRPRPISRPSRAPSSTTPPGSLERRLRPDIAVPRGDRCRRPDSGAPSIAQPLVPVGRASPRAFPLLASPLPAV